MDAGRERPLLMTPDNGQKSHVGTKTQTRRILKSQPEEGMTILGPEMFSPCKIDKNGDIYPGEDIYGVYSDDGEWGLKCPYGVPGDRLWCKEAWRLSGDCANKSTTEIPKEDAWLYTDHLRYRGESHSEGIDKWRSGMLMPRWACRTVLEITEIRVQRVQDITNIDALAEGCGLSLPLCPSYEGWASSAHIALFRELWQSINGPDSWAQNPWVWVISYRKVQP